MDGQQGLRHAEESDLVSVDLSSMMVLELAENARKDGMSCIVSNVAILAENIPWERSF